MLEQRLEVLARFKVSYSSTGRDEMLVVRLLDGSMLPEFLPGDVLVFSADLESHQGPGGLFLYALCDGAGACFMQEKSGEDRWVFLNEKYGEYRLPKEEALFDKFFTDLVKTYALVARIPVDHKGTVLSSGPVAEWFRECAAIEAGRPGGD